MKIALKDVLPNPNRDLTFNPYNENKIAELMDSIRETDFWDNVVCRKSPTQAGKYEMAYGHHRVEAARRSGITEASFIVKSLNDDKMLRMMDLENSKEYGYSILSLLEVVKAVVNALAEGRIPPFEIVADTRKDSIRFAPSFIPGKVPDDNLSSRPYTVLDVAKRLGPKYTRTYGENEEADKKVRVALDTLALLETEDLTIASVKDQNIDQLYKITSDKKRWKTAKIKVQKETTAEATKLHDKKAKEDADRREVEEKERLKQVELQRIQAEARRLEDEEKVEQLSEEFKRRAKDAEKRAEHFAAKRAVLDKQIEENEERAQQAKIQDKDLPVRHAASTCLTKLKTIVSERNALREELRTLGLKPLTQSERENIRQALLAAATWFEEQSVAFRPALQTDVLKEAREKEAAKHKREKP